MGWVMIVSVMWSIGGAPAGESTWAEMSFKTKELCDAATATIFDEMSKPVDEGVKTYVHAVCVQRK